MLIQNRYIKRIQIYNDTIIRHCTHISQRELMFVHKRSKLPEFHKDSVPDKYLMTQE